MATNLYSFYQSQGKTLPSLQERAKTYEAQGLGPASSYVGSSSQNTSLLQKLSGGQSAPVAPTAPAPTYAAPTASAPVVTPTATQAPQMGVSAPQGEEALIAAMTQKGHTTETAKAAIAGRGYDDLAREYLGAGSSGGTGQMFNQPTIDLNSIYKNLYSSSGVAEAETKLTDTEKQYMEARAKITDNPFLDASVIDKRLARLDAKYEATSKPMRDAIAMKKADIETQLNIQMKQFDIQSQQAQQALNQFNVLLSSGALDSASGTDIANITASTGLSSGIIQSAINNRRLSNLTTTTKTFDDGVEEGFIVYTIDPGGNIVNEQRKVTGPSAKKATTQYSTDSFVNNYLSTILSQNGGTGSTTPNISSLWGD